MSILQMQRRAFMAALGGAAAWPMVGRAQQQKTWKIAYLHAGFWDSPGDLRLFEAFRDELIKLGYVEGKNLVIEKRSGEGKYDRLATAATDLVALHPDVIVAVATPAIAAAQKATTTIPIIMTPSTDPIGSGFVKSFAHPGGNITGLANMFGDLTAKSLEFVHAVVPTAKNVCVLMSSNPTHPPLYKVAAGAAQMFEMTAEPIVAKAPSDLRAAFEEMVKLRCDAVFVLADPIRPTIVTLANSFRIPAIYQFREFVEAGGLASYGPSLSAMWRRSAQYVDKVFKGADPADLPVEQPTAFELVLNAKTAKSLGLKLTDALLLHADEVIE
jgi:putative tryptophan/tyrosine transport system substrate-binding protein